MTVDRGDLETLTPAEIAEILKVSARTVREMLSRGELPGFQLRAGEGGRAGDWRSRRVDIQAWMAERGREGRETPDARISRRAAEAGT